MGVCAAPVQAVFAAAVVAGHGVPPIVGGGRGRGELSAATPPPPLKATHWLIAGNAVAVCPHPTSSPPPARLRYTRRASASSA